MKKKVIENLIQLLGRQRKIEGNEKNYFLLEENDKIEVQKIAKRKVEEQREEYHENTSTKPIVEKKNPKRQRKLPQKLTL